MKIYTDRPEMLSGHIPVNDPELADVIVAFSPDFLRGGHIKEKIIYLVAKRAPVSLAGSGLAVKLVSLDTLETALTTGELTKPARPKNREEPRHVDPQGQRKTVEKRVEIEQLEIPPQQDESATPRQESPPQQVLPSVTMPQVSIANLYVSYSPGTDVGKTFLSSNLAGWFASQGRRTVLIDMDMGGSGTWEMIHMREQFGSPYQTLADWDGTDNGILDIAKRHAHPGIKNLHVLLLGGISDPERIMASLSVLARQYTVVVDTSNNLDLPHISSVLQFAGKIFLIGRLTAKVQTRISEMYSNTRRAMAGGRVTLVVNRVGMKSDERRLHPVDLARQFGFRQHYVIHEDEKARATSLKKRTMPVFLNTRAGTELKAIFEKEFLNETPATKKKGGFLNFFKRRDA